MTAAPMAWDDRVALAGSLASYLWNVGGLVTTAEIEPDETWFHVHVHGWRGTLPDGNPCATVMIPANPGRTGQNVSVLASDDSKAAARAEALVEAWRFMMRGDRGDSGAKSTAARFAAEMGRQLA